MSFKSVKYSLSIGRRQLDARKKPARKNPVLHAGESWTIESAEGKTFSIIAIAPNTNVSEHGLEWELDRSPLDLLADTGISNVVRSTATIQVHTGTAIAYLYQ